MEYAEKAGHFWDLRYPLADGSGYLELATTRPETMLGDTAIAVHPDDERYQHLIGKMLILPLMDREIPIVADTYVDMEFGTGVVKITPAHDPNDFEVGLRHDLPIINIMTDDAHINENGGKYCGMDLMTARKAVVEDLDKGGFLVKVEEHSHNVGECYRCSTTVEPRVSKQWFVKMQPLAEPAIEAVKQGKTKFVPERFDKTYYHWMENIKDWCISRQLWWGHRIPAYYCQDCGEMVVSKETVSVCPKCGSHNMKQDEDTLDTWFSSALWPFSTLGWPENTEDLKYFYPTSTLVTGYDIIFFWVARMIFSGVEHMGEVPFDTVLIHGLVRDAQGRKMSKSLGNGIDPMEVIDEFGADALRFMLATGNSPGNDMRYTPERITASRNFANKLWNATRFILMNLSEETDKVELPSELLAEDKWVLSKYNNLIREVTANLEKFELGIAVQKLYDFIWDILCDWYIELTKARLNAGGETSVNAQKVLVYVMSNTLKLLHPFMPFITEEIWQALPHDGESIMIAKYPEYDSALSFEKEEADFERVMEAIRTSRNARAEKNIPPSKKAAVYVETPYEEIFMNAAPFFVRLASTSELIVGKDFDLGNTMQLVTDCARIFIPMGDLIDTEKELERLNKEKAACEKDIQFLNGKLSNEKFVSKAPEAVVAQEKEKLEKANERLAKILQSIQDLG